MTTKPLTLSRATYASTGSKRKRSRSRSASAERTKNHNGTNGNQEGRTNSKNSRPRLSKPSPPPVRSPNAVANQYLQNLVSRFPIQPHEKPQRVTNYLQAIHYELLQSNSGYSKTSYYQNLKYIHARLHETLSFSLLISLHHTIQEFTKWAEYPPYAEALYSPRTSISEEERWGYWQCIRREDEHHARIPDGEAVWRTLIETVNLAELIPQEGNMSTLLARNEAERTLIDRHAMFCGDYGKEAQANEMVRRKKVELTLRKWLTDRVDIVVYRKYDVVKVIDAQLGQDKDTVWEQRYLVKSLLRLGNLNHTPVLMDKRKLDAYPTGAILIPEEVVLGSWILGQYPNADLSRVAGLDVQGKPVQLGNHEVIQPEIPQDRTTHDFLLTLFYLRGLSRAVAAWGASDLNPSRKSLPDINVPPRPVGQGNPAPIPSCRWATYPIEHPAVGLLEKHIFLHNRIVGVNVATPISHAPPKDPRITSLTIFAHHGETNFHSIPSLGPGTHTHSPVPVAAIYAYIRDVLTVPNITFFPGKRFCVGVFDAYANVRAHSRGHNERGKNRNNAEGMLRCDFSMVEAEAVRGDGCWWEKMVEERCLTEMEVEVSLDLQL